MTLINVLKLISDMKDCLGWPYKSPGSTARDASSGIDCSGMWTRAFRLQGSDIYHGSNTIYRTCCTKICKYDPKKLEPGVAVFKVRNDGKEPEKYRGDGKGNAYHVGASTGYTPQEIIDSSAGGVKMGRGGWTHMGWVKNVEYAQQRIEEAELMTGTATVTAESGKTVNVRLAPRRTAVQVGQLPLGTQVEIVEDEGDWCKIRYTTEGYMMSKYLTEGVG